MIRSRACIVTSVVFVLLSLNGCASRSRGPLFERKEPNVEAGIAAMRRNAPPEALAAFDRAAAQYPAAPEVPLDRGLALLATGTFARAREAFVRALGEGASTDLRAEALYDIGLTHHREADAPPAAGQEPDREQVMQSLRDAIEAYRRSLRTKPGQRDVAWNLEIALRRQHEEEEQQRQEQQEQEQQQEQQQQEQQQANQDQQQQDQQQQGDQNQQDQQNQQQGDQNQQDQQNQQASQDQQQQQGSDSSGQTPPPQPDAQQGAQADAQQRPEPREPQPAEARPASAQPDSADSLTPEMRGMLDALDRGEGSLEEERARARAARENRRPLQDW